MTATIHPFPEFQQYRAKGKSRSERALEREIARDAARRERLRQRAPRTAAMIYRLDSILVDNALVIGDPWRREQVENIRLQMTEGVEITEELERRILATLDEVCQA